MKCPACGAAVEDGADLCLECGEPMGDTPAAKVARAEPQGDAGNIIRPPVTTFQQPKSVSPPTRPAAPAPAAGAPPAGAPATKPAPVKRWRTDEPEPRRCPGCGGKTLAPRCPGCGIKLIHDDE